ncbi:MAG: hypothetical protein SVR81_01775, partial [Chloroflexota bacterium]|nr:hypothetical protein [Chloroflexota bacterium]
ILPDPPIAIRLRLQLAFEPDHFQQNEVMEPHLAVVNPVEADIQTAADVDDCAVGLLTQICPGLAIIFLVSQSNMDVLPEISHLFTKQLRRLLSMNRS